LLKTSLFPTVHVKQGQNAFIKHNKMQEI